MNKPKIGILPLYIALYDQTSPDRRVLLEGFYQQICMDLRFKGIDVVTSKTCCVKAEFEEAVASFEKADVDALVTLHLAYSPSLESADVLAKTHLPIIVLDTTPHYEFDHTISSSKVGANHGIHGVQDMCNMLIRNGKDFQIFAGHYEKSSVLDDVANAARGAKMARVMKNAKVGHLGGPFDGMGDFAIPADELEKTIGMTVKTFVDGEMPAVSEDEIKAEYASDCEKFAMNDVTYEQYKGSCRTALGIRKWLAANGLNAFTMNFMGVNGATQFDYMPFAEACKAMGEGIGYAGEGDVMTAALVASLLSVYDETSFAEMFCPNWRDDTIYLSHMGEYNVKCAGSKPDCRVCRFPYGTNAGDPISMMTVFKPGDAVYVSLCPIGNGKYRFILTKTEVLEVPYETSFRDDVSGWMKACKPLGEFLAEFSRLGGIHHGALVYGGDIKALSSFGKLMGWEVAIIE